MENKKVLTTIHLEKSDHEAAKELAKFLDKSQSAVIRQAIRELAEKHLSKK